MAVPWLGGKIFIVDVRERAGGTERQRQTETNIQRLQKEFRAGGEGSRLDVAGSACKRSKDSGRASWGRGKPCPYVENKGCLGGGTPRSWHGL